MNKTEPFILDATAEVCKYISDCEEWEEIEVKKILTTAVEGALTAERNEMERERMCHAACGVISMSNTRESLEENRAMKPEYLSASVHSCIKMAEREISLREQLAAVQKELDASVKWEDHNETLDELAAERDLHLGPDGSDLSEIVSKQVAAERERCQVLVDALHLIAQGSFGTFERKTAKDALTKYKKDQSNV
jgi:ATP-dependent Lon protease